MIKDELSIDSYTIHELNNLSSDAIDVILYITKELICQNGMASVTADDIVSEIEENWGDD